MDMMILILYGFILLLLDSPAIDSVLVKEKVMTPCMDETGGQSNGTWFYASGGPHSPTVSCVPPNYEKGEFKGFIDQLIFSARIRHNCGVTCEKAEWNLPFIRMYLKPVVSNNKEKGWLKGTNAILHAKVKIGYFPGHHQNDIRELLTTDVIGQISCVDSTNSGDSTLNCQKMFIFEYGPVDSQDFLVNVRLPYDPYDEANQNLGMLHDPVLIVESIDFDDRQSKDIASLHLF